MSEQKPKEGSRTIHTGSGAYVEGGVETSGGDFVGRDQIVYGGGSDARGLARAFGELYKAMEKVPEGPKKAIATTAVKGLEEEARKGGDATEENVEQWFESLLLMLPDIGEVAVRTFLNPIDGLSAVFRKVAQKAKESREAKRGS